MSDRVGGILSFVVDGVQFEVEGKFEIQPLRGKRKSLQGLTGPAGHSWEPAQPSFDGVAYYKAGVSLMAIHAFENVTAQLTCYNGARWILQGATQTEELTLDVVAGTFPLKLEGNFMQEIPPT